MNRALLVLAIAVLGACHHVSTTPKQIKRDTYVLPLLIKDTDWICLPRGQNDVTMPCRTMGELRAYVFYTLKAN